MLASARVPLRWRYEGQRSQGSSGEEQPFALCARDGLDRFQCSLRPESRSAGGMEVRGLRSQGSSGKKQLSRFALGKG